MDWVNGERIGVAIFPSLPKGIDLALQLIGEAIRVEGAWASVNAKPMSSLTKLWQRLDCYRDSLGTSDRTRYCHEKSALFNTLVGCEHHLCPVPCQFICTPCMKMTQEGSEVGVMQRYDVAVALAEIDWCPNLHLPQQKEEQSGNNLLPLKIQSSNS
jgi:hypothetical protein